MANELININVTNNEDGVITVSGRELHAALEVRTAYKDWFPRMCEYGFIEGRDFNPLKIERVQNEGKRSVVREVTDHQLTIDMAKEVCMIQRTEIGKRCREYFLNLEKQWNSPVAVMARALQIAGKQLEQLKTENVLLTTKIEEDAPKVAFADTVANSSDCITIGAFSKVLYDKEGISIGRNRLFKYLRDNRYLRRNNEPYQKWIKAGLFQYTPIQINTVYGEQVYNQTQITGKGQIYLSEKLRTDNSQHKLSDYLHTMRHTGFPTKTKK